MNPKQIAKIITEDPDLFNESDLKLRQLEKQYKSHPSLNSGINYLQYLLRSGQDLNNVSLQIVQSKEFQELLENYFNPLIENRFPPLWDNTNYTFDSYLTNELPDMSYYDYEFGNPKIIPPYWTIKTENNEQYKYSSDALIDDFEYIADHIYGVIFFGNEGTTIELCLSIPAHLLEIINYYQSSNLGGSR